MALTLLALPCLQAHRGTRQRGGPLLAHQRPGRSELALPGGAAAGVKCREGTASGFNSISLVLQMPLVLCLPWSPLHPAPRCLGWQHSSGARPGCAAALPTGTQQHFGACKTQQGELQAARAPESSSHASPEEHSSCPLRRAAFCPLSGFPAAPKASPGALPGSCCFSSLCLRLRSKLQHPINRLAWRTAKQENVTQIKVTPWLK